jgi:hypothetical protein
MNFEGKKKIMHETFNRFLFSTMYVQMIYYVTIYNKCLIAYIRAIPAFTTMYIFMLYMVTLYTKTSCTNNSNMDAHDYLCSPDLICLFTMNVLLPT